MNARTEIAANNKAIAAHKRTCKAGTDIFDPKVSEAIRETVRLQLRNTQLQNQIKGKA